MLTSEPTHTMRSGSQKFSGYPVTSPPPLHVVGGGGGIHNTVMAPQRLRYAADVEAAGFKRRSDGRASVSAQTATLVLFVLCSAFGCLMTVALSYKSHAWHADTNRQIEAVIESIDDLRAFTDVVRAELLAQAKRADGRRDQEQGRKRDVSYTDYDEEMLPQLDNNDYDNGRDRFMGVDLDGNAGLPAKPDRGRPPQQQTAAAVERRGESTAGRRRRNASIDTVKVAKNQLNRCAKWRRPRIGGGGRLEARGHRDHFAPGPRFGKFPGHPLLKSESIEMARC